MAPPPGVLMEKMDEDCSQSIEVTVFMPGWNEAVTDVEGFCRKTALKALGDLPEDVRDRVELGIQLEGDDKVRALNARWRNMDKPTNVLSFPALDPEEDWPAVGPVLLGDIVVAQETVEREADEAGIGVDAHLAHMIVHGVLHLMGHDHLEDDEAERMEARERVILAELGHADPYARSEPMSGLAAATGEA
ncbi:MAG: rRNA maturation RNase YbeY [Geminicoccaceae bacterium]